MSEQEDVKEDVKMVKITIDINSVEDEAVAFGIVFSRKGAKGKERYIAEVPLDLAQSLIDAEKVLVVK